MSNNPIMGHHLSSLGEPLKEQLKIEDSTFEDLCKKTINEVLHFAEWFVYVTYQNDLLMILPIS